MTVMILLAIILPILSPWLMLAAGLFLVVGGVFVFMGNYRAGK